MLRPVHLKYPSKWQNHKIGDMNLPGGRQGYRNQDELTQPKKVLTTQNLKIILR